jgi:PKD repeat protein
MPLQALQIGVDRKIYGEASTGVYLDRIENPNTPAANVFYTDSAVYLNGNSTTSGLPDFIASYFHLAYFDYAHHCVGHPTKFSVRNPAVTSVQWDFGDPGSGALNQSTLFIAEHQYDTVGSYLVTLIVSDTASTDTFTRLIDIQQGPRSFDFDDTIYRCAGKAFDFSLQQNIPIVYYLWSNGSDSSAISISDTGKYWGVIYNFCDTLSDTFRIIEPGPLNFDLGLDTSICKNDTLRISIGLDTNIDFVWMNGDTVRQSMEVGSWLSTDLEDLLVWIEGENTCEIQRDSLLVSFLPIPNVLLPPNMQQCGDTNIVLFLPNESGVDHYWNDSASDLVKTVAQDTVVWLTASNICGQSSDTFSAVFFPPIEVELGPDQTLCAG